MLGDTETYRDHNWCLICHATYAAEVRFLIFGRNSLPQPQESTRTCLRVSR